MNTRKARRTEASALVTEASALVTEASALALELSVRSLDGKRGPARALLEKALRAALRDLPSGGRRRYVVEVAYAGDAMMRRLNARFAGERAVTDVLAFPAHQELPDGRYLLGEVIVNRDEARRHRHEAGGVMPELLRYVIHGVLHMVGYDDATPELKKRMWQKQEEILGTRA